MFNNVFFEFCLAFYEKIYFYYNNFFGLLDFIVIPKFIVVFFERIGAFFVGATWVILFNSMDLIKDRMNYNSSSFDVILVYIVISFLFPNIILLVKACSYVFNNSDEIVYAFRRFRRKISFIFLLSIIIMYFIFVKEGFLNIYGPAEMLLFYSGLDEGTKASIGGYLITFISVICAGYIASSQWEKQSKINHGINLIEKLFDLNVNHLSFIKEIKILYIKYGFDDNDNDLGNLISYCEECDEHISSLFVNLDRINLLENFYFSEIVDMKIEGKDIALYIRSIVNLTHDIRMKYSDLISSIRSFYDKGESRSREDYGVVKNKLEDFNSVVSSAQEKIYFLGFEASVMVKNDIYNLHCLLRKAARD